MNRYICSLLRLNHHAAPKSPLSSQAHRHFQPDAIVPNAVICLIAHAFHSHIVLRARRQTSSQQILDLAKDVFWMLCVLQEAPF